MGCVECKICHQEEEKNQFEYPSTSPKKNESNIDNSQFNDVENILDTNTCPSPNPHFFQEFDSKIQSIGRYISEEEFQSLITENSDIYIPNEPFPFYTKNNFSHKMKPVEFEQGNIYYGEWNEDFEMDGYGKYYLKNEKILAEGIWEKGELKKARIFYPNGEFYEGEIADSCYNGKGKLININKDEYIGQFAEGEKNGEGKIIFNDGTEYNGNFSKNNFSGYGEIKWKNGIEYKGNFVDNMMQGNGTMTGKGEKYEGSFEKNLFNGKGKYTYYNGDEYDGEFEYGIRKGKGTYKQKNGLIYEGMWENNIPNGFGKINFNGNIIKCNFHNGKIIEKPVDKNGLYYNNVDYNFYCDSMNLSGNRLTHLDNIDVMSSQYRAGTVLSFLEE